MLATLSQKPWLVASLAGELADLHREMASVVAPQWMIDHREWANGARAAAGEEGADSSKPLVGGSALHMDLHPGNVMLGPDGKVTVIDFGFWTVGEWQQAAAQTYLVLTTANAADSGFSWWCVSRAVLVRHYRACCWQLSDYRWVICWIFAGRRQSRGWGERCSHDSFWRAAGERKC